MPVIEDEVRVEKRVFWKRGLFWFGLIIVAYLIVVGIEESIYKKLKGDWTTYTTKDSSLLDNHIRVLVTDDKGQVWIGTEKGLYVISSNGTWITYTEENSGLLNHEIQALAVDGPGRIWVGTRNGLYVLDSNGQWTSYIEWNEHASMYIQALAVDSMNRVWVGTFGGLSVFEANRVETTYTKNNSGLIHNYVTALAVDRTDRIWIGTFGHGVSVVDQNGNWATYQENRQQRAENGLVDNNISIFLIDQQDQVWIGTDHGISILSPGDKWNSYSASQWEIPSQRRVWTQR
jgi:ligand-binding sensor domain-containing protein